MLDLFMAEVGDGLCMSINTISHKTIFLDCGSMQGGKTAFIGFERIFRIANANRNTFILSHFHSDHYNGIFHIKKNSINLDKVCFPRMPDFKEKEELILAFLCMTKRVLGNGTSTMETDFIRIMQGISTNGFHARHLSMGEIVNISGLRAEVLWPPLTISEEDKISGIIKKALEDFKKARDIDKELRDIYEKVEKEDLYKSYLSAKEHEKKYNNGNNHDNIPKGDVKEVGFPSIIQEANDSLRKVANNLSLSFVIDDRFLFLGDLENSEIRQVTNRLNSSERRDFWVLITPHHGTHWDSSLENIRFGYALSSNGNKLISKMNAGFKEISQRNLATFVNGDIGLNFGFTPPPFPFYVEWF